MANKFGFFDDESLSRTARNRSVSEEDGSDFSFRRKRAEPVDSFTNGDQQLATPAEVPSSRPLITKAAVLRRGHALSYAALFLFTVVLYFRPYELFKSLAALDKVAFVLAIVTLLIFIPSQIVLEGNLTARVRPVILVALLAIAGLLSIPGAINPSEAWAEFNDVFIKAVLIFIVMVNVVRTEKRLRWLFYVTLGVTVLLSVTAIGDYRRGNFTVEGYRIKGLLGGMFENPNDLALHLVTMIPLSVGLMFAARRISGKIFYAAIAILIVSASVVTYSRGGFIGLLVVAGMLAWKIGRNHKLGVAILGPICIAAFITLAPGNYGMRILSIFVPSLDPFGSATSRQEILNRSIIVSIRHPLLGIGMGNFHIMSLHETVTHNAFTQVSSEMGTGALVVYMMFLTWPLIRLRRMERETFAMRRKSSFHFLAIGLQASIVGYMVSGFFAAVAYQWYAYYLVGYSVCLCRVYESYRATLPASGGETNSQVAQSGGSWFFAPTLGTAQAPD